MSELSGRVLAEIRSGNFTSAQLSRRLAVPIRTVRAVVRELKAVGKIEWWPRWYGGTVQGGYARVWRVLESDAGESQS